MREPTPQFSPARHRARLVLAAGLLLLVLWLMQGILAAVAWAVILSIALWPLYYRLRGLLGSRHHALAAGVSTALAAGLVGSLLSLLLMEVGRDGPALVEWLKGAQESGVPVPGWVAHLPVLGSVADEWWRRHLSHPDGFAALFKDVDQQSLATWTGAVGGQVLYRLFLGALTFLTLFFLFRDGEWASERLFVFANGWLGQPGERLAEKIAEAVRGTVNGTIVVAVGEGVLIGAGYIVAGVPHAVLFALVTTLFALVPFGAWLAFTAASLTLLVTTGGVLASVCLFAFSAAVMLIGDNIAQPALIGGAARLPFLWALFGIIGGLERFGFIGLFLGPVIMAGLLVVWREWWDVSPAPQESRQLPARTQAL